MSDGKVYEMQWDCKYCGTNKLLGKTHRFCPNCGAAQDPDTRYFPSDDEKVAVEDHVFVGVDKICGSCGTLNSGSAEFCQQCGAPLTEAARARTLGDDQVIRDGEAFTSSGSPDLAQERFDSEMERIGVRQPDKAPGKRNFAAIGCVALIAVAIVAVLVAIFWRQDTSAYVTGHSWEREVRIEQLSAVSQSAWCDQMPGDAYSISRRQEQRSSRQVQDGEECSTRRVDQGDGTFREVRECRPRYRSEPVYDDRCYFTVNRWGYTRSIKAEGASLSEAPNWPAVTLSRSGTCLGCEREGGRNDTYSVYLREGDNTYTCNVDQEQWAAMPIESTWTFSVGVLTGQPDCSSLEPAG